MLADCFFTIGAITMGMAPSIWSLALGRFIIGLGVGVASQVPLYLAEIAPVEVRGQCVTMHVLCTTFA